MNVWPAIVAVPLRIAPVFAATLKVTDPLPVPDAPLDTVIQETLLAAVHEHQLAVETAIVAVPPVAANDCDTGEIAKLQDEESWMTVKGCEPTETVPTRVLPLFAATPTGIVALPVPDALPSIVSQFAAVEAVHPQAGPVVRLSVAVPPPAPTD